MAIQLALYLSVYCNRLSHSKSAILSWIKEAWLAISPGVVRKSFNECVISSTLDGTEYRDLFEASADKNGQVNTKLEGFTSEDVSKAKHSVRSAYGIGLEINLPTDTVTDHNSYER